MEYELDVPLVSMLDMDTSGRRAGVVAGDAVVLSRMTTSALKPFWPLGVAVGVDSTMLMSSSFTSPLR